MVIFQAAAKAETAVPFFLEAFLHGGIQLVYISLHILFTGKLLEPFDGIVEKGIVGHGALDLMGGIFGQLAAEVVHQLLVVDVLVTVG